MRRPTSNIPLSDQWPVYPRQEARNIYVSKHDEAIAFGLAMLGLIVLFVFAVLS